MAVLEGTNEDTYPLRREDEKWSIQPHGRNERAPDLEIHK